VQFFRSQKYLGAYATSLYKIHIDRISVNRMLVDRGVCMNIMLCSLFKKLDGGENDLMKMNMTLSGFSGDANEAKGVVSKELMVGSKTIPTAFFMVEVKGKYNILLGRD
jgi:hypothetical protein